MVGVEDLDISHPSYNSVEETRYVVHALPCQKDDGRKVMVPSQFWIPDLWLKTGSVTRTGVCWLRGLVSRVFFMKIIEVHIGRIPENDSDGTNEVYFGVSYSLFPFICR